MKIGQQGIDLIKHFESLSLVAYKDGAGVWTIGYGTTKIDGTPVKQGMRCTEEEVSKLVDGVAISQNKFDALVSFAYNLGSGALKISSLLRNIKRDSPITEKNFTDWSKIRVNGILTPSAGLTRRRKSEFTLFSQNKLQFKF